MTNEERDAAIKDIAEKVGEIHTSMEVMQDAVKRHDKTLYGNGRPGLAERFQAVEDQQRSCPALQEKLLSNKIGRVGNIIQLVALLVAIAAVVVAAFI